MGKVVKGVFGGGETKQQRHQGRVEETNRAFSKEQAAQARADALGISTAGNQNRNQGFQAALDVLGQTIPQQFRAFSEGNVGAQGNLLSGLDQFRNSILGGQVDLSQITPQGINVETGFAQQQLPAFIDPSAGVNQRQFRGDVEDVFRAELGRGVDPEGLAFFSDQLAQGRDIGSIADDIRGSTEGLAFTSPQELRAAEEAFRQAVIQNSGAGPRSPVTGGPLNINPFTGGLSTRSNPFGTR